MKNIQPKESPVTKFTNRVQIFPPYMGDSDAVDRSIREWELRIRETRRKIGELAERLDEMKKDGTFRALQRGREWIENLNSLWAVLGVYQIMEDDGMADSWIWKRLRDGITDNVWADFLGEQTEMRVRGGWVVVGLSDEGVSYLNGIAKEVLSSSYTTP